MVKRKAGILKVLVLDERPDFINQVKEMFRPYRHVRVEGHGPSETQLDYFDSSTADLIIMEFKPTSKLIDKLVAQNCPIVFVSHDEKVIKFIQLTHPTAGFAAMPLDPASFLGEVNQLVRLAG